MFLKFVYIYSYKWKLTSLITIHFIFLQNDMVALLFQLSLFRTFQKILNDDSAKASAYKEMKTFALYVVRQFFKIAEKVFHSFLI